MPDNNKLNEVPLANLDNSELELLKQLETKLNNKYYIIAFENNGQ